MVTYSVDGAMAEALGHLNRIACHVRSPIPFEKQLAEFQDSSASTVSTSRPMKWES